LVKHAQNNFENGKKIDTTDLLTLFEANIFNDSQKKELLRIFIPNMTLSKAVSLWIYSQKDAKRYKKIIAKEAVAARGWNVDMIVANMKDSEISIPTYQLLSKTINVEKIIDDGNLLQDFVNDYNAVVDEVSDSMKNIKTLEDFQWELARYPEKVKSSNPMKNWAYDFKEWSIIEIRQTKKAEGSSEEIFLYWKILKAWNAWEIKLLDRWSGKYSTNSDVISTQTYDDLLKTVLWADTVSFTVMSEDDIKDKIYLWEIDEEAPDRLEQRTPDQIEEKRDELMKQLDARKAHLKSEWKTKEEIEADEEIEAISNKHRVLSDALEKVDEFNKNALLRELDELDPEWKKHWLDDWMTFRVWKWDQKDLVFTVTVVNPLSKKLLITSPGGNQEMDFQDFYYNFKQGDCKRISSKMTNFQGIIDSINIDWDIKIRPTWDGFEMKDGQLQKKESKTGLQYNFLAGAKWENEELLQIHDESWGLFTISFWKIKDKTEKKEVKGKDGNMKEEKKVTENFTVYKWTTVVTAGWLDEYIKKHKLVPRSLDDSKDTTYNKGEELEQKFNPWSFLGKWLNIATVVASGKVFHESLENFFKDWRDERAARFAYAWWKHLLPWDMKTDLMSRIEDAQEKRMEDYLARLKKISSSAATKMIKGWLSDPHVKQEKHEAAVEFMLEKYGTLCAKGPLFPYQWKFKWYQALGGRLWDKLYKEEEQKALVSGQQFSEEALVWKLMVLQCKPECMTWIKFHLLWLSHELYIILIQKLPMMLWRNFLLKGGCLWWWGLCHIQRIKIFLMKLF